MYATESRFYSIQFRVQNHLSTAQQFKIKQSDINRYCLALKYGTVEEKALKYVHTKIHKRALSEVRDFYSMNLYQFYYITNMAFGAGIRIMLSGQTWYHFVQKIIPHHKIHGNIRIYHQVSILRRSR